MYKQTNIHFIDTYTVGYKVEKLPIYTEYKLQSDDFFKWVIIKISKTIRLSQNI